MKIYFGTVTNDRDWRVHVLDIDDSEVLSSARDGLDLYFGMERKELPLRLDIANKSPSGFSWGYGGSGPHQLAIALIAHAYGLKKRAVLEPLHVRSLVSELTGIVGQLANWVISDTIIKAKVERSVRASARPLLVE